MNALILGAIAAAANVIGAAMAAPQAVALRRTGVAAGVSPVWAGLGVALNGWWVAYATAVKQWAILPVAVMSTVLYAVIVVALLHGEATNTPTWRGIALRRVALAMVLATIPPTLTLIASGWAAAGVVLGAAYAAQLTPAVVATYRSSDISGIATMTWKLAWAEAALFGIYGFARGDVGLLVLAAAGVSAATAILARVALRRRTVERRPGSILVNNAVA